MENYFGLAASLTRDLDFRLKMQNAGCDGLFARAVCVDCGKELEDDERENCGDWCFDCYQKMAQDDYNTSRHPDSWGRAI